MATQENLELVPQEELNKLRELDSLLSQNISKIEKLSTSSVNLIKVLNNQNISYSDLNNAIGEQTKIEKDLATIQQEKTKIENEIERVRKRVLAAQTAEGRELEKYRQQLRQVNQENRLRTQQDTAAAGSTVQLTARLKELTAQYKALSAEARKGSIGKGLLSEINLVKDQISGANSGLTSFTSGLSKGIPIIGKFFAAFSAFSIIKSAANTIIEFEQANSELAAILGTNSEGIQDLTRDAERFGSTTRFTASQVTNLQTELARLGFTQREIRDSTEAVLLFAQATGSTLANAAQLTGSTLRAFNANTRETTRFVSAMAVATTNSALNFQYLDSALSTVAPVANAFNFSIEDTIALLGTLANAGFNASTAATATRNILLNLADSNGALAQRLGTTVSSADDLVKALITLRDSGVDLNETLELTDRRSVAAFNAFLDQAEGITTLRDSITDANDDFRQIAETMDNNVRGAIYGLQSAWEGFILSFSESKGVIKSTIDLLAQGIRYVTSIMRDVDQIDRDLAETRAERIRQRNKELNVEENYANEISRIYNQLVEDGINAAEANEIAIERVTSGLISNLEAVEGEISALMENYSEYNFPLRERLAEASAEAIVLKERIDALNSLQFAPVNNQSSTRTQGLSEKDAEKARREAERAERERLAQQRKAIQEETQLIRFRATVEAEANSEILRNNLESYEARRQAAENYYTVMSKAIEDARKEQLKQEDLSTTAITLINEKADYELVKLEKDKNKKLLDLDKEYLNAQKSQLDQYRQSELQSLKIQQTEEETLLLQSYASGEISKEEFEAKKLDLQKEYGKRRFDVELEGFNQLAQLYIKDVQEYEKYLQSIAQLRADYEKEQAEQSAKTADEAEKAQEAAARRLQRALTQLASQLNRTVFSLIDARLERQLQAIDTEMKEFSEAYNKRIELIKEQEEAGLISSDEANAQRRFYAQEEEARQEQLNEQRNKILREQAKNDKAQALIDAAINTAVAVTAALKAGPIAGPILAAVVAATGAAQIAAISAQPLPQYAEGTADHPGGLAIVGDGGKSELIQTPSGQLYKTPSVPTVVDLPKHAEVFPDFGKEMNRINQANMQSVVYLNDGKQVQLLGKSNLYLKASIDSQSRLVKLQAENNRILNRSSIFNIANSEKRN